MKTMCEERTIKTKVTQEELYNYLLSHDIKLIRLAELVQKKSNSVIYMCFHNQINNFGHTCFFTNQQVDAINDALPELAHKIYSLMLSFGSKLTYKNMRGNTYDPAVIEQFKALVKYFNIKELTKRILGWSKYKKDYVLLKKNSICYGCISEADVNAINQEIISIVNTLSSIEMVRKEKPES